MSDRCLNSYSSLVPGHFELGVKGGNEVDAPVRMSQMPCANVFRARKAEEEPAAGVLGWSHSKSHTSKE